MNRHLFAVLVLLLIASFSSQSNDSIGTNGVQIDYGSSNPVCRSVANTIYGISVEGFRGGAWRKEFGEIDWHRDSFPTITAEGWPGKVWFEYSSLDIDNNRADEIVVMETVFFTSIDWDRLWVFTREEFARAQKENSFRKLLSTFPTLNPQNVVSFSNGKTAVPVEIHIWKHKKKNYLLMKEHFFAGEEQIQEGRVLPNAFYVGVLDGQMFSKYDPVLKANRLIPKMLCRFVWQ